MVVVLKCYRFQIFVNDIHEVFPDPARPGSALEIPDALRRIAAYPDRRCIVVSESAEPSVLGFIRRTCLAGAGHSVIQPQAASGAPSFLHNALKHAHHLSGRVLVIDLGSGSLVGIDRIASVVINSADAGRNTVFPVVLQRAETGCHLYRFNAVSESAQTCRERIVGIHDHRIMHGLELAQAVPGGNVLIYLPSDRVEGPLDRFLELDLAHIGAVEVLGAVLNLLVLNICAGIIASFESGSIYDQRLDRTAGLAVALECAIE